jgi:Fe2+ transport system protein B
MLAEMNAKMDATQEKMDANPKEMQARKKDTMGRQIGSLVSIMEAARKTDRDEMKREIRTGQEHMQDMITTSKEKMKGTIQSIRSERDETWVENIMTRFNHKTESPQKPLQKTAKPATK